MKGVLGGGQESLLVLEDFDSGFVVTRAKVGNKDKKIKIFGPTFAKTFEEIKRPFPPVDKVILAVGSRKAVTVESVIRVGRSEPDQAISEAELDTLVFRGLWEFLNRYRSAASKKLGISDPDLILAGAEIREVSLGSYRVFNPLGFKGDNLHLRYRGTFIRRELKALIEKMENWGREKILVEGGGILALTLPQPFDYFAFVDDRLTDVFAGSEEENLHLKTLSWGSGRILNKIASVFDIEAETALKALLLFDEKPLSRKIKAAIEKAIKEEIESLVKMLPGSSPKGKYPSLYLTFNLPFAFFEKFLGPRMKVVDFRDWLIKQGYGVIMNRENMPFFNLGNTLALITHVYSSPQYRFLNNLLARRARWLTAN